MMRRTFITACMLLIAGQLSGPAWGGTIVPTTIPMVTLSSPQDLSHLMVGDTFKVDVNLTGLAVGSNFIFVLDTRELFPTSLVQLVPDPSNSSGLTPGPVLSLVPPLPNVPQVNNFTALSSTSPGVVNGNFSDSSPNLSAAINQNGVYYSFVLKAIAVGTGQVAFDAAGTQYAANDTGFNLAPMPYGGPLAFNVVPEPSSLVLAALGVVPTLVLTAIKRKTRTLPINSEPA